ILAIVFFYTISVFGITPKTILFIYLIISFVAILFWRLYGVSILSSKQRQPALLIGSGEEMKELLEEVNGNDKYGISFITSIDVYNLDAMNIQEDIITPVYSNDIK